MPPPGTASAATLNTANGDRKGASTSTGFLPSGLSPQYWSTWEIDARDARGSVAESLGEGEAWIGGWNDVGLYEGNNKVSNYQSMTIHITTHRLLLVPDSGPGRPLHAPLAAVRQTEFYTGFMRSSPKITLFLGRVPVVDQITKGAVNLDTSSPAGASTPARSSSTPAPSTTTGGEQVVVSQTWITPAPAPADNWTCGVCGFSNALLPGQNLSPATKCQLCGVNYAMSKTMSLPPSRTATPVAARSAAPSPWSSSTASLPQPSQPTTAPAPLQSAPPLEPPPVPAQIACPACTFLNHTSMKTCEMCGTPLPRPSSTSKRTPATQASLSTTDRHDVVRLSFRKDGSKDAYRKLKGVLSDKVWERVAAGPARKVTSDENRPGGGIDAIMKSISLDARAHDEGMVDAFRDLEILMVRAGEMVRLAQSLNAKLSSASGGTSDEEATLVRSSLVRLGLPAPALTQDMVRDERAYLDGLARELGGLLTGKRKGKGKVGAAEDDDALMMRPGHGVIGLDTVWGLWMRARGVALLPPATLVSLLSLLPQHTNPAIRAMNLPSGLTVLYAPLYAPSVLLHRLVKRMTPDPGEGGEGEPQGLGAEVGLSIIEIAAVEGLPIGLATEMVDMIATRAVASGAMGIVRDDQAGPREGGVKWYRDIISGWPLGAVEAT